MINAPAIRTSLLVASFVALAVGAALAQTRAAARARSS